jgi:hypothetical protein
VLVVVNIESTKFRDGLDTKTATTEAALAKKLAAQLQAMFPPIEWVTTAPADGAAATIIASLTQNTLPMPAISLHWAGKVGDRALAFHELRDWPVYDVTNPIRPYRDADKLIADVDARLVEFMGSEETERKLHDDFVVQVPLATRVDLDQQRQAVVLPLSWARAKLADSCKFRLEFTRAQPLSQMTVLLGQVAEVLEGDDRGKTQSRLASCAASGDPIDGADRWQKCIAVLDSPGAPPLLVKFEDYKFSDRISGVAASGTAVTP